MAAVDPVEGLGMGIYKPSSVARLTDIETRKVMRWLEGYSFKDRKGKPRESGPLFKPDLRIVGKEKALSFYDLIDVLCVKAFLGAGVSMHTIRKAAAIAIQKFGRKHPFCLRRFMTDGKTILAKYQDELQETRLLDLLRQQHAFEAVLIPYLRNVDYDTDSATKWWPLGKERRVLVDPHRSFGAPIVPEGTPTLILFKSFKAQRQSRDAVADWFEVSPDSVTDAVEFEESMAA